jgi:predicted Zn finger-like uncharacterized protein
MILFWGRNMAAPSSIKSFTCPNCQALYQIVKVEAGPETVSQEVPCRVCGTPLAGRDGKFVLKYFLLREATRAQKSRSGQKAQRDVAGAELAFDAASFTPNASVCGTWLLFWDRDFKIIEGSITRSAGPDVPGVASTNR